MMECMIRPIVESAQNVCVHAAARGAWGHGLKRFSCHMLHF